MPKDKESKGKMMKKRKGKRNDDIGSIAAQEDEESCVYVPRKLSKGSERDLERLKNEQKITNIRLKTILHNQRQFSRQISRLENSLKNWNGVSFPTSHFNPTLPGSSVEECVHGEVLQENIKMLVKEIRLSSDSLLIDEMYEKNCLTETDAEEINEVKTSNKTRQMILHLSRKDKTTFQTFIKIISKPEYFPHVAEILNESYRKKLQNKEKRSECIPCFIVKNVDVMRIADYLCERNVIDLETLQNVMSGDKAELNCFWQQIFKKLTNPLHGKMYMSILKLALQENYKHIARKIQCKSQLTCFCSSGILSYPSSSTDNTSEFSTTSTIPPKPNFYTLYWIQEELKARGRDDASSSYSDSGEIMNSKKHSNISRKRRLVTLDDEDDEEEKEEEEY